MSGIIDGAESWSVDDFGEWSFADDEVRINGAGIRIHAASLTDADQNQLHWQSTAGALVAGIYGFVDDANDNRGLALRAESADVTASIGLTASSDFANASVSIEAFADGESRIEFGASRVDALGALYVNRVLVIRPGGIYSEPGGPMDGLYLYFDTNTNTLKAVFPNGSVRTLATG